VPALRKRALIEALGSSFSGEELKRALSGIDIIGDLAVIKLPRAWEGRGHEIGGLLLSRMTRVKGIFRQTTAACRGEKVRSLEWLAGKEETTTIYKEYGCQFHLDIAKVYFSPRLSYERFRIAKLTTSGEVIVNMFAGIGTFSIVIAKNRAGVRVYSIDKSKAAFDFMVENVALNGLNGTVVPILGDAKEAAAGLMGMADRVLMPLPELVYEYLPYGVACLKEGGWIHAYTHQEGASRRQAVEEAEGKVRNRIEEFSAVKEISGRSVRSVGRRMYQVAVDARIVGGS
jgi:tRNA (guanine37-N1)-methyltransferase